MLDSTKNILVATDGSEDGSLAARAAADLSGQTGAALHVVHVWQNVASPHLQGYIRAGLEQRGRDCLDSEVESLRAEGVEVAGDHLLVGSTSDRILDLAQEIEAGLVVVGGRGHGRVGRLLLGSVSEAVAQHAACPVLVVRGGAWPPSGVVVGDDGSRSAEHAADLALSFAGLYGLRAKLVRAHPNPIPPSGSWSAAEDRAIAETLASEEEDLKRRAAELSRKSGVSCEHAFETEDPALALLDAAGESGFALLAVGSRGLGGVRRAMLGSVSTKVLRAAKGPVLVCPERASGGEGA